MGTFNWPPAGTWTWPHTGTFSWPPTACLPYPVSDSWARAPGRCEVYRILVQFKTPALRASVPDPAASPRWVPGTAVRSV